MASVLTKRYIDPETGGFVSAVEIADMVNEERAKIAPKERFDWARIYLSILSYLVKIVSSPRFTVLIILLQSRDGRTNESSLSFEELARRAETSVKTVERLFDGLKRYDLIRPVRKGAWMINPKLFATGGRKKLQALRIVYSQLAKNKQSQQNVLDSQGCFEDDENEKGAWID